MMKRKLAAHVALACTGMGATIAAHAQSTVMLYGLIDLGVQYANNVQVRAQPGHLTGASQFAMTDAHATGLSGSRWGLRGAEDLGGGMKAIFVLENGFMANTGTLAQGGAEFGRQAYAGLQSAAIGTLTLGRQYDPYLEFVQPLSATVHVRRLHGLAPGRRRQSREHQSREQRGQIHDEQIRRLQRRRHV